MPQSAIGAPVPPTLICAHIAISFPSQIARLGASAPSTQLTAFLSSSSSLMSLPLNLPRWRLTLEWPGYHDSDPYPLISTSNTALLPTPRTHSQHPNVTHFQRKTQVLASGARQFQ